MAEGQEVDMEEVEEESRQLMDKAGVEDLDSDSDLSEKLYPFYLKLGCT